MLGAIPNRASLAEVSRMGYYRLYLLADRRHIDAFHAFEAEGDQAAVAKLEPWLGEREMELWTGSRLVQKWSDPCAHLAVARGA